MRRVHGAWLWRVAGALGPSRGVAIGLVAVALLVMGVWPSAAGEVKKPEQLVEKARFTLANFVADPNMDAFRDLIKKAKSVFIMPQLLKGAFIFGGSGGSGVFLARDERTGTWSEPAFYTLGGVSFGFQAGGQASEVVLLFMSERGVSAMLGSSFKLGADASVALGPVGAGVGGESVALSADIIAFSRAKGLYGGVSLEGSVVAVREEWNRAYYGKSVSPTDILVHRAVRNSKSARLIQAVAQAVSAGPASRP